MKKYTQAFIEAGRLFTAEAHFLLALCRHLPQIKHAEGESISELDWTSTNALGVNAAGSGLELNFYSGLRAALRGQNR